MTLISKQFLYCIPLILFKGINYQKPIGLIYHLVSDEIVPHTQYIIKTKSIKQFKKDLDYILKYYEPVDMTDISLNRTIKKDKVFFTFDDGYREVYEFVVPIFEAKGINAGIFMPTDFIDNRNLGHRNKISLIIYTVKQDKDKARIISDYLNLKEKGLNPLVHKILQFGYKDQAQINKLAELIDIDFDEYLIKKKPYLTKEQLNVLQEKGFYIGAHSIDHPYYQDLSSKEQIIQTLQSVNYFRENFNNTIDIFALPFSNRNIERDFYDKIKEEVDIVLGTEGLGKNNEIDNLIERVEMENGLNADISLKKEYLKLLYIKLIQS